MTGPAIRLVPVTHAHKLALQRGGAQLQDLLGVRLPEGWPQFPEAFAVQGDGDVPSPAWPSYFFVCPAQAALVGNGGFAGPPNDAGEVEIGYEIAPAHQGQGHATAAVRALLDHAFAHAEVTAVVAHTLAEVNASNAVLRKVGMAMVAELPNAEVGTVWKWCIRR